MVSQRKINYFVNGSNGGKGCLKSIESCDTRFENNHKKPCVNNLHTGLLIYIYGTVFAEPYFYLFSTFGVCCGAAPMPAQPSAFQLCFQIVNHFSVWCRRGHTYA